jgi:hypothetical protein
MGILRWSPTAGAWYVQFAYRRMWEWPDGCWYDIAPQAQPWGDQPIGLGVTRCPTVAADDRQPDRRLTFHPPVTRWAYVTRRRAEGATWAQIGRELGVTRERARQLYHSGPMWRWRD